jgi:molecular chaperone HtpG
VRKFAAKGSSSRPVTTATAGAESLRDADGVPTALENIPFDADDIGVFLMESITKGLYKDPMNVLREYISNEIDNDPPPTRIRIQVGANRVEISGDGPGMDRAAARIAVRVGYSPKDRMKNIGFRGIGIYSGVAICKKIILSTKKKGAKTTLVVVIDAAGLRDDFENRSKISLVQSLKNNVRWRDVPAPPGTESTQGTAVSLIGLDPSASDLSDEDKLRPYLQNALPVKLDPKFPGGAEIDKFLGKQLGGEYNPVSLVLGTTEIYRSPNIGQLNRTS